MKIYFWYTVVLVVTWAMYGGFILIALPTAVALGPLSIFLAPIMYLLWGSGVMLYAGWLAFSCPLPMIYLFYRYFISVPLRVVWAVSILFGLAVIYLQMQFFFPSAYVDENKWRMFEYQAFIQEWRPLSVYGALALPVMFCGLFTFHNDIGKAMLRSTSKI